jgi:hypothetical protein
VSAAIADGLSKMWIFYTVLAGIGLVASFGIGKIEVSKVHVETETGLKKEKEREVRAASPGRKGDGLDKCHLVVCGFTE